MYQESMGSRKTLGDVDIIFHEGIYHLFHLVLPNHDYIAHAVSNDCVRWRQVENALFIGDPGSWDDSMLWTVHVSENPHRKGHWRMFYTGLSRRDQGKKQRIGLAESDNLYAWQKVPVNWQDKRTPLPYSLPGKPKSPAFEYDADSCYPLQPDSHYYESEIDTARHWVSWRDPFYFNDGDNGWLFCAARVDHGPIVRRGCVACLEEAGDGHFTAREPLFHPGLFDDVEVPNVILIGDYYYLIGSIREEARVRYWRATSLSGPWVSLSDNELITVGNYAGRVSADDKGFLFWCFFSERATERTVKNFMPPPKRLFQKPNGELALKSFEGFNQLVKARLDTTKICPLIDAGFADAGAVDNSKLVDNDRKIESKDADRPINDSFLNESCIISENCLTLRHHAGFEIYLFQHDVTAFRLQASVTASELGQCGVVFRLDPNLRDGYYLALDFRRARAELRAWGTSDTPVGDRAIRYDVLQTGYWDASSQPLAISLIVYGSYIELSIGGEVVLSLVNQIFRHGRVGFYTDTATLNVHDANLEELQSPIQSDEQLATG